MGFGSLVLEDLGLKPFGCKYFPFPTLMWVVFPLPLLLTGAVEDTVELDVCVEDTSKGPESRVFWGLFLRCVIVCGILGSDVEGTAVPSLGVACRRDNREVPACPVLGGEVILFFFFPVVTHSGKDEGMAGVDVAVGVGMVREESLSTPSSESISGISPSAPRGTESSPSPLKGKRNSSSEESRRRTKRCWGAWRTSADQEGKRGVTKSR